jgi:hypothetical protein
VGGEEKKKPLNIVDCPNNREVIVKERAVDKITRTFAFDRVFGPNSRQMEQTQCSEMSAIKHHMLGHNPKDYTQHSEHGESLKSRGTYYLKWSRIRVLGR